MESSNLELARRNARVTLQKKIEIIEKSENHPSLSITQIARDFDVSRSCVSKILKAKETIKVNKKCYSLQSARIRTSTKAPVVEKALLVWLKQKHAQDTRISRSLLKEKAQKLSMELGVEFTPSEGWLSRFKKRHDIIYKKEDEEKQATEIWKTQTIADIESRYASKDIFNADESGLYYRAFADRGNTFKNFQLSGGQDKRVKEHVTILVCANKDGSEKRPLTIIGKLKHPCCFPPDLNLLPFPYVCSTNAVMTVAIFTEILKTWDRQLALQSRKIALILDSCSAHPHGLEQDLKNIELFFLPPNVTLAIQPMDMGVIKSLKGFYRAAITCRIITELNVDPEATAIDVANKISLLDAICLLKEAWQKVEAASIENCFVKAGFGGGADLDLEEGMSVDDLWQFSEEVDKDLPVSVTTGQFSDSVTAETAQAANCPEHEKNEEENEDVVPALPSTKDLLHAFSTVRTFVQHQGLSVDDSFSHLYDQMTKYAQDNKIKREASLDSEILIKREASLDSEVEIKREATHVSF